MKKPSAHRLKRLDEVCTHIGHPFRDVGLLDLALSHSSLGNKGLPNYERLEFLGDAVLGFLVAEFLYRCVPEIPEGELTARRSLMVSRQPLAEVGESLGLADYVHAGRGLTDDNLRSPRILADLVEAVLGAVYLDGGIRAARRFVREFIIDRFHRDAARVGNTTDAKTRLNQLAQSHGLGNPIYEILTTVGPDHNPTFTVAVRVGDVQAASEEVKSKQAGEQQAAASAYAQLVARLEGDANPDQDPGDDDIPLVWS
ncbi:MAG: ribonuclease III [Planctomycetes bacterium]|nr:ribonuclease III [Planctomycetota bacterium]MCB9889646.1 ribonuclease III [Planctomycetota bacterium]